MTRVAALRSSLPKGRLGNEADNRSIFGYADYIAERFNKQPQFAAIARDIRSLLVHRDRPPTLLEVGCGFGYFLNEAFEEGFEVSGVEFNRGAVERLRRKYRFPIQQGPLEEIALEEDHYDVLAMFDVIEHLRFDTGGLERGQHPIERSALPRR